jgi:hypothetical protein
MFRSISCSVALRSSLLAAAAVVAVGLAAAAAPARADDPPGYTVREGEPHLGTNIPRPEGSSFVPPDATWTELTPEQQASVRSLYEAMPQGDEPPYPLRGEGALMRPIGQAHQQIGDDGMLVLFIDVNSKGEATRVEVVKTPSERIGTAAAEIAMATRFKPAVCHGQPCAMGYPLRIKLTHHL